MHVLKILTRFAAKDVFDILDAHVSLNQVAIRDLDFFGNSYLNISGHGAPADLCCCKSVF